MLVTELIEDGVDHVALAKTLVVADRCLLPPQPMTEQQLEAMLHKLEDDRAECSDLTNISNELQALRTMSPAELTALQWFDHVTTAASGHGLSCTKITLCPIKSGTRLHSRAGDERRSRHLMHRLHRAASWTASDRCRLECAVAYRSIGAADGSDADMSTEEALDEIVRLHPAVEAIKQATIEGRVCDDIAWFDFITTLHDFCEQTLTPCMS